MKQKNADISTEDKFNQIPCKLLRNLTIHHKAVLPGRLHYSFFVLLKKKSIINLRSLWIPVCYTGPSTTSHCNTHPRQQAASLNAVSEDLFFFKQAPYGITCVKGVIPEKKAGSSASESRRIPHVVLDINSVLIQRLGNLVSTKLTFFTGVIFPKETHLFPFLIPNTGTLFSAVKWYRSKNKKICVCMRKELETKTEIDL